MSDENRFYSILINLNYNLKNNSQPTFIYIFMFVLSSKIDPPKIFYNIKTKNLIFGNSNVEILM